MRSNYACVTLDHAVIGFEPGVGLLELGKGTTREAALAICRLLAVTELHSVAALTIMVAQEVTFPKLPTFPSLRWGKGRPEGP